LSRNKGTITKATANMLKTNIPDMWSEVAQWKVPRGYFAQFTTNQGINLYFATAVIKTHGGTGVETFDLNADAPVIDSAARTDDLTAKAYATGDNSELTVSSIDYVNNQVDVDHNVNEEIKIVYLPTGGAARINVYRPSSGVQSFNLFEKAVATLHSMEQDNTDSLLTLDDPFPAPAKYLVKVELNAPFEIEWSEGLRNTISHMSVPFRKQDINRLSQAHISRINRLFVSK
jgi:hypothetical protein